MCFYLNRGSWWSCATHSLFLQVVTHLLVFMFHQLLIAIVIVLSKDGLNLCIRVAFPEQRSLKQSGNAHISKERLNENQNRAFFTLSDPDEVRQNSICRRPAVDCQWCHLQLFSSASASSKLCCIPERERVGSNALVSYVKASVHSLNNGGQDCKEIRSSSVLSQHSVKCGGLIPSLWNQSFPSQTVAATCQPSPPSRCRWWWQGTCSGRTEGEEGWVRGMQQVNKGNKHKGSTYHENEENEEDKGHKVDGSKHCIGFLNFWELKVSQDDTELCESAQMETTL